MIAKVSKRVSSEERNLKEQHRGGQTAGDPPKTGNSILAAIGWIKNSKAEPTNVASEKKMRCARTRFRIAEFLSLEAVIDKSVMKELEEGEEAEDVVSVNCSQTTGTVVGRRS